MSKSCAFYEPPQRKTSAEIINEARIAIRESQMAESTFISTTIKPLQTQRPFTPRNKERILFGKRAKSDRPPSSFSLRYLQNETDPPGNPIESTSIVTTPNKLSSLNNSESRTRSNSISEINDNKIFNIGLKEPMCKIKLPSLDHPKLIRKISKNNSLDDLPEEHEIDGRKSFSSSSQRRPCKESSNLANCLLLEPQNLNKLFENKQIVQNSETLFVQTGYLNRDLAGIEHPILVNKERSIDDVLSDLNVKSAKFGNDDSVLKLLDELYEFMGNESDKNGKISSKLKINILRSLYKYVEWKNEQLLLSLARIILTLKVTGNNLNGVCKLIFKVAKNDKNDHLFGKKNLLDLFLDALGRSSPLDDAEACVYAYGSIKFLTMNSKLLAQFLDLGILPLMVLHIKIMNDAKQDTKSTLPAQTNHVLFQITGALRNIVSVDTNFELFLSSGAIQQLCQAMDLFSSDNEIVGNISSILSTISTNDCCCDILADCKDIYTIFIKTFETHPGYEEIIVRLAYTLGNIVAKIDSTRVKFYGEPNSINSLLNLWKIYLERTLKMHSLKTDNDLIENGNPEDVMIKIIRVIANVVINPDIGKELNKAYGSLVIDEFLQVLISNPFKKNQDLVMSILSTLNNLSYYYNSDLEQDVFHIKQVDIIEGISEYAKSKNKECVVEALRIMGNLSRSKITRDYIAESELFPVLIKILDKVDLTLLKTGVGVFVNLMADVRARKLFRKHEGVQKMIKILQDFAVNDWVLAMLVCQVIWNYCIDTTDLYQLMPSEQVQELLVILADFLDEEKLFGISEDALHLEEVVTTQEYLIWEEFANVATNVLEKVEYFLDTFDVDGDEEKETKTNECSTNINFTEW